jgi:DNA-binding response OmpR family regulator
MSRPVEPFPVGFSLGHHSAVLLDLTIQNHDFYWGDMNPVSKRILCMVPDDDFCLLLSIILKKEGFEVIESKSITEAIHLAKKDHCDLFLVSDNFGGGEGIDFVRVARPSYANVPIVLISGWADNKDAKAGLEAGASAYLTKPVENEVIIRTVKSLLTPSAIFTA